MLGLKYPLNEAIVLYGWTNFADVYKMTPMGMAHHGPPKIRIGHARTDVLGCVATLPYQNQPIKTRHAHAGLNTGVGPNIVMWLEAAEPDNNS